MEARTLRYLAILNVLIGISTVSYQWGRYSEWKQQERNAIMLIPRIGDAMEVLVKYTLDEKGDRHDTEEIVHGRVVFSDRNKDGHYVAIIRSTEKRVGDILIEYNEYGNFIGPERVVSVQFLGFATTVTGGNLKAAIAQLQL